MGIIKILLIISCFSLLIGCSEELMTYDVTTGTPIVESYLQEGNNFLTVKVYSMEIYLKDDYELSWPIEDLQLNINGRELTETAEGTYSLNLGEDTIRELQNYNLSFEYGGKTVSASTAIPMPVTNLSIEPEYITRTSSYYFWDTADTTEIKLTWDDPDNNYYQIYIESPASSDMPAMGGDMQFRRRMMQPFKGNSYTTTSREFMSVGYYTISVYRVNKDYVDLYERISSTDLINPSSAIQNAFGIFTAMSVAKVRFQVIEADTD
ncbi:MAG: DUF4249 domain-containing protein [Dysgonamonadaceae bacterium]|jgi:hypothetical protein|nr:DUF4249 domain-containing protein [Dysgonamonadaceae bacterium]